MTKSVLTHVLGVLCIGVMIGSILAGPARTVRAAADTVGVPGGTFAEADDFPFIDLGDAWDMNEFSDVSQFLNGAGRHPSLTNIQVQNGTFSAKSIGDYTTVLASFFPLFPGLSGFMEIGKDLGSTHPIDTRRYQCLYLAMKVNSPAWYQNGPQPDTHRVMWYADKNLTPMGSAPNGGMGVWTYPESVGANAVPMTHKWKLFKIDLNNPPGQLGVRWGDRASWPGLEIQPTIYANIDFSVDWVRLTSCQNDSAYQARITWTPDYNITAVWLRPQGTTHDIQVATGVNGSSGATTLDTKGLPPGAYQVGVGDINTCCSQRSSGVLTINRSTLVTFDRPSPSSGVDYAQAGGNAWDMDASDVTKIECSTWSFANGLLNLDTLPPAKQPSGCRGKDLGEVDSRIYLNMPASLPAGEAYRYLSFRMYIGGSLPLPVDGMMARWIWTLGNNCTQVSADIGYDIGWQTYNVDLFNSFNGTPVSAAPAGCAKKPWWQAGRITKLRFDPNENYTGIQVQPAMTFHQEYDWIRLTRVDRARQGAIFPIEGTLNKDLTAVTRLTLYFTTDLSQPTQHLIGNYPLATQESISLEPPADSISAPEANTRVYLPSVSNKHVTYPPLETNQFRYLWNTSGVPLGEYTICAQANDGHNTTTDCSTAPLQIVSP